MIGILVPRLPRAATLRTFERDIAQQIDSTALLVTSGDSIGTLAAAVGAARIPNDGVTFRNLMDVARSRSVGIPRPGGDAWDAVETRLDDALADLHANPSSRRAYVVIVDAWMMSDQYGADRRLLATIAATLADADVPPGCIICPSGSVTNLSGPLMAGLSGMGIDVGVLMEDATVTNEAFGPAGWLVVNRQAMGDMAWLAPAADSELTGKRLAFVG